jgi:uncharacterized protein
MDTSMLLSTTFQNELDNVVQQLSTKYNPEKIILFGSFANGNIQENSDIDLFIIKDNVPYHGIDRIRELDNLISYTIPVDFIVYTQAEVMHCISSGDVFIQNIFQSGRVLYDAAA